MRTLFHPKIEDIAVENILHALSDPTRALIYMQLAQAERAQNCTVFLSLRKQTLPKSTVSQHFRILREAGLVRSERRGVELINTTRCEELKKKFGLLLPSIIAAYQGAKPHGRKK